MDYDFRQAYFFLSISVLGVVITLIFGIYSKIRKLLPVTVNCWFCNTWSKVLYDNRNSFDCPNCLQYNGFTKDGSYNKIIEAQHNVTLKTRDSLDAKSSNGFCYSCNHNQQLKITQLANFTPLKEKNYDVEIEHFKKQLEKAYQLCKHCSKILKITLLKQKAAFFGLHAFNIQKNGLNVYINNSNKVRTKPKSVRFIKKVQGSVALLLMLYMLVQIVISHDAVTLLPNVLLSYYELFQDLYLFISHIIIDLLQYFYGSFPVNVEIIKIEYISSLGLTFQLILLLLESSLISIKINQILCWSFLTMTSWTSNQEIFYYTYIFQIFCTSLIIYHSFYEFDIYVPNKKTFHKLKDLSDKVDEYSDEELDVSSQSTCNSCHSFKNSGGSKNLFNLSINKEGSKSLYSKTESNMYTASNSLNTSINTARNLENAFLYSDIQSSLEDLHLSNPTFQINKSTSLPYSNLSLSDQSKLSSPSKLKTISQNSWVAGGFWRNEDGTIMSDSENVPLSRSSSQSSGFSSQVNENLNNLNNPFTSLPRSAINSFYDIDRFSPASEPSYFQSFNSQPSWTSIADLPAVSPSYSGDFRNTHMSLNQTNDKFVFHTGNQFKKPVFSNKQITNRQLGLFKLPQLSTSNLGTQSSNIENKDCSTHPLNINRYTMNNETF